MSEFLQLFFDFVFHECNPTPSSAAKVHFRAL